MILEARKSHVDESRTTSTITEDYRRKTKLNYLVCWKRWWNNKIARGDCYMQVNIFLYMCKWIIYEFYLNSLILW